MMKMNSPGSVPAQSKARLSLVDDKWETCAVPTGCLAWREID
jgi:hypothetical protein